jgi:hypothetical protein
MPHMPAQLITVAEPFESMWSLVETPHLPQGASKFGYDAAHHVIYASAMQSGVWRIRLE